MTPIEVSLEVGRHTPSLALAVALSRFFVAASIGGDPWFGLALLVLMLVCTVGVRHPEPAQRDRGG